MKESLEVVYNDDADVAETFIDPFDCGILSDEDSTKIQWTICQDLNSELEMMEANLVDAAMLQKSKTVDSVMMDQHFHQIFFYVQFWKRFKEFKTFSYPVNESFVKHKKIQHQLNYSIYYYEYIS